VSASAQETLEYNSRLIERKLADFGVQVRSLAAYPGPVITRYEIEPAVGVKGAQIVNLAKDLARCAVAGVGARRRNGARQVVRWRWNCRTPSDRWCACWRSSPARNITTCRRRWR
jgi:hypothetical protein